MLYVIILSIFLIPISSIITIKGTIVWWPQFLAVQFIGVLCYASMFWKINKFLAIFLAYLAFSYIFVTLGSPRNMLCLMIGLLAATIILIIYNLKDTRKIYIGLIFMSCISTAYAMLQAFGYDPIFVPIGPGKEDVVSFMGSHNQLGIYSCASAFWAPWLMPLALIPIGLCKCASAFIATFFGALCYVHFNYGKSFSQLGLIFAFILIIPAWYFFGKSSGEIMERIDLWKLSIKQTIEGKSEINMPEFTNKNSPLYVVESKRKITCNHWFGYGLGNFFSISGRTQKDILLNTKIDKPLGHFYEHAHNDLVEAFYEFGYLGFGILVCLIISVVLLFVNSIKTSGVVITFSSLLAQSIASLSVYVFHAPVSLFMFCLTLGLFFAEVKNAKSCA